MFAVEPKQAQVALRVRVLPTQKVFDNLSTDRYSKSMPNSVTTTRILDAAQSLVQKRGYNAFSYMDLAEIVGIRTASIHYHYPTKTDLGVSLMSRYIGELESTLAEIDRNYPSNYAKLKAFVGLDKTIESSGVICLCGSLASDRETLPEPLQEEIAEYLKKTEIWVARVISNGIKQGEFKYSGKPVDVARAMVSALQGGLILSRAREDKSLMISAVQRVLFKTLETG